MKRIISVGIFLFSVFLSFVNAQTDDLYQHFLRFSEDFSSGDFISAENEMESVLKTKKSLPEVYLVAAKNNLGIVLYQLGKYNEALECYNDAEANVTNKVKDSKLLADIYLNKSRIYTYRKSFYMSIEYLEKAITIYLSIKDPDKILLHRISSAYLNIGINYYSIKEYNTALEYLIRSYKLKTKMNLPEKAFPLLNIAKVYSATNRTLAEKYYLKSISAFTEEYGEKYYRKAEAYFDYGLFLRSEGRIIESLQIHKRALSICLKNYGEKHPLVSLSYKHIGDHYLNNYVYDSALYYYQKSILAVVGNFNDQDINANPSLDSVIFDIRLLDNLKCKAVALKLLGSQLNDKIQKLSTLKKSLETVDTAFKLIEQVRKNNFTEESRIYLAENEKETYIFAISLANQIYSITGDNSQILKMYDIANRSKVAILRDEISENELVSSSAISDSLLKKRNKISGNIFTYKNLITEELRKSDPDKIKISLWKDEIFEMKRDKEKIEDIIDSEFPQYHKLLQKVKPTTLKEVQKRLTKGETVIDYFLSNEYSGGKRKLYSFIITKKNLKFRETDLDSLFLKNVDLVLNNLTNSVSYQKSELTSTSYATALFYMYNDLIKPIEKLIDGRRLIIIPDEEIGLLPFDAFLKNMPTSLQTDFEGLNFLINDYTISFGYSTSLIFGDGNASGTDGRVLAFSTDNNNSSESIPGTVLEINSIFKLFKGQEFTRDEATETNFKEAIQSPSIIHLAMHSATDSVNSMYSYLKFNQQSDTLNDGKLFNYEIGLSKVNSTMVVLSACNSGTGTLSHGEGLMSLSRGFLLAGASSVIETAWKINDETSAAIITRFYYHLSRGKPKDEALRLAKLEYIKDNPPIYSNPYYWAAYEVLGDNSAIVKNTDKWVLLIISLSGLIFLILIIVYLKRRSIFFARSL
jgi:CHAT domain-containing protein/tetratricopeptide (TPR) repeat protein